MFTLIGRSFGLVVKRSGGAAEVVFLLRVIFFFITEIGVLLLMFEG